MTKHSTPRADRTLHTVAAARNPNFPDSNILAFTTYKAAGTVVAVGRVIPQAPASPAHMLLVFFLEDNGEYVGRFNPDYSRDEVIALYRQAVETHRREKRLGCEVHG